MPKGINRQVRLVIAFLLVVAAAYIAGVPLPSPFSDATKEAPASIDSNMWYPLVRVSDGDTIVINIDGANVPVRLIGIDSPELDSSYTKEQCFGKESSAEAKKILGVGQVRLETDSSQDMYDQYDRLLTYVYVPANVQPEGIMLNAYMVSEGFAREYTYKKPYAHQASFKAHEEQAREQKKGLWGTCLPAQAGSSQ